jgi:hypothetical protein
MSGSSTGTPREPGSYADRTSELQHVTVERDGVAVCTMFPQASTEDSLSTRWITATDESFVSLEERR